MYSIDSSQYKKLFRCTHQSTVDVKDRILTLMTMGTVVVDIPFGYRHLLETIDKIVFPHNNKVTVKINHCDAQYIPNINNVSTLRIQVRVKMEDIHTILSKFNSVNSLYLDDKIDSFCFTEFIMKYNTIKHVYTPGPRSGEIVLLFQIVNKCLQLEKPIRHIVELSEDLFDANLDKYV